MIPFILSVALAAFLLFQVQPLLGRYILPWFGGGPSVWTSCLLFFQLLLLAGYAYAHALATRFAPRTQAILHLSLLGVSLFTLPIAPDAEVWKKAAAADPTGEILLLLLLTVGLPYWLLSATTPLVQGWFHAAYPQRSAYRLYAVSNAASLVALVSYPFVFEPLFPVRTQAATWSWCYGAFVVACAWAAAAAARSAARSDLLENARPGEKTGDKTGTATVLFWMALSACGSTLLMATTNQLSQEIAVFPFLWVLPLALYLLSFIATFESDRWYKRAAFGFALAAAAPAACAVLAAGAVVPLGAQLGIYSTAMFIGCMACHGELARSRPAARHSTRFYLIVAAGGALGGLFVALAAPLLFPGYWEYPLALAGCCALTLGGWLRDGRRRPSLRKPFSLRGAPAALSIAILTVGYAFWATASDDAVTAVRGFYGVFRVVEQKDANGKLLALTHGRTEHGTQYLAADMRRWPTAYYGPGSGAALAFERHPARLAGRAEPLRVGVIGLGAGTMAAYGRAGERFRFYEINPDVVAVAETYFSYLADSEAEVSTAVGDARVLLEAELAEHGPRRFDILAVDAFSSGAIPIHLLTAEAGQVYGAHLAEDGLLLFHISNRFLDLAPVVRALGERLRMEAVLVDSKADQRFGTNDATWMILTRNRAFLEDREVRPFVESSASAPVLVWTDNFAGLWQALR